MKGDVFIYQELMDATDATQAHTGRPFTFLFLETHPDCRGFTYQIGFRYKAPVTAVRGVIPVITHHEVLARRHNPGSQLLAGLLEIHPQLNYDLPVTAGRITASAWYDVRYF
jgi:hypothetical protein